MEIYNYFVTWIKNNVIFKQLNLDVVFILLQTT